MYQYLQGTLAEKNPVAVVVDVNGVGFLLQISLSTFSALPALGDRVRLWTHFVVREDAQMLCGFFTEEERELFRMLISVSGIGPKSAMTVLSGVPVEELKRAIAQGSLHVLTAIPGIGKKTAERLVVELREKLVAEKYPARLSTLAVGDQGRVMEDSLQALVALGYKKNDAKSAIEKTLKDKTAVDLSVEDLIRLSLKNL